MANHTVTPTPLWMGQPYTLLKHYPSVSCLELPSPPRSEGYGSSAGPMHLTSLNCSGGEGGWEECRWENATFSPCTSGDAAGLECCESAGPSTRHTVHLHTLDPVHGTLYMCLPWCSVPRGCASRVIYLIRTARLALGPWCSVLIQYAHYSSILIVKAVTSSNSPSEGYMFLPIYYNLHILQFNDLQ